MPTPEISQATESSSVGLSEENVFSPRRVRHMTAIQVRNLTPFPVRDAFASALSKPSEQSQFTVQGHLSDDLDVTSSRKRSRRISINSIHTLRSLKSDDSVEDDTGHGVGLGDSRGRRRAGSRVSFSGGGSLEAGSSTTARQRSSTSGSAPTIRPAYRARTNSVASSVNTQALTQSSPTLPVSFSAIISNNSQLNLEKVIKSRLVETFLSISLPSTLQLNEVPVTDATPTRPEFSHVQSSTPRSAPPLRETFSVKQHKLSHSTSNPTQRGSIPSPLPSDKRTASRSLVAPKPPLSKPPNHAKSSSITTIRPQSKKIASSSTAPQRLPGSPFPSPRHPTPPVASPSTPTQLPTIPDYLSPIHRPSTNPSFSFTPRYEFAEWSDLSQEKIKVELWGRVVEGWRSSVIINGKGKEKEKDQSNGVLPEDVAEWKVLEEWNINLIDLVPLPNDLISRPSHLPSNTLLVTLSPPGQIFYLPSPNLPFARSPTPSAGYNSDPELEVRKVKQSEEGLATSSGLPLNYPSDFALSRRRYRRHVSKQSESIRDISKTAGWQDMFKLVTLQSCITDTEGSLSDIVWEIDKLLEADAISPLKREVSERELRIERLQADREIVREHSDKLKAQIEQRRAGLRQRREILLLAKEQHEEELSSALEEDAIVSEARDRLSTLRAYLPPTRTTLLSTLSTIFPIELLSPPDLLFTILDVPLPIPLSSTDPAPPLSLPAYKDINEDTVASSLGFAAQLVQLLALYLGKGLVYPVTCIGSRSLIRDGISAMVGPRMFPLYSKGVDTYRFEYGVFLLNKDIELLMADRELRALDMRHTLPNLKNLLLTLTDGEGVQLNLPRSPISPITSVSDLESPHFEESTLPAEANNGVPGLQSVSEETESSITPPESGTTTPVAGTSEGHRKTRAFLGLSPLADFLRSRYPSTSSWPSIKPVIETDESHQNGDAVSVSINRSEHSDDGEDDEADRRTIRGLVLDGVQGKVLNGNRHVVENGEGGGPKEKLSDETLVIPVQPTTTPPLILHSG